jgi:leucyl-tRNA synthetase
MHLLYSRFFWKVARDMGMADGDEPMLRLFNQGMVLGPDGQKMSKSRGNVVAPDPEIDQHGADAFRCQLMFVGPWDQGGPFNPRGIAGINRWLQRVWSLVNDGVTPAAAPDAGAAREMRRLTHRTIEVVTRDIETFSFNTMIARLMEHSNATARYREQGDVDAAAWDEAVDSLLLLMAPLAPHLAEELWERRGRPYSVHQQPWPAFDPELARQDEVELVVQVNGKVRDRVRLATSTSEDEARAAALALPRVHEILDGSLPRRLVYVPGKLINIVV